MTLGSDKVLYLPVTTEITSLPQLTPEGLPLALARRAAEARRMAGAEARVGRSGRGGHFAGAGREGTHLAEHCMHLAPTARNGCDGGCISVISSAI